MATRTKADYIALAKALEAKRALLYISLERAAVRLREAEEGVDRADERAREAEDNAARARWLLKRAYGRNTVVNEHVKVLTGERNEARRLVRKLEKQLRAATASSSPATNGDPSPPSDRPSEEASPRPASR